jgi:hypothetical protein
MLFINSILSGQTSPTDLAALKDVYEKGRQKVGKTEEEAVERSPIASRVGEGAGLLAAGASGASPALYGGAAAALGGNTPFIAGNNQQKMDVAKQTALGTLLGYGTGKAGEAIGNTIATSPAAKAFLASMKGTDLTGDEAITKAGSNLLNESENASNALEQKRIELGKARQNIEDTSGGQAVYLNDVMPELESKVDNLTGSQSIDEGKEALKEVLPENPEQPISLLEALDLKKKLQAIYLDDNFHPTVRSTAREMFRDLDNSLVEQVPGLEENNALYSAIKKAQDVFGKEYNESDQLVQSGRQANLLNRATKDTLTGQIAKSELNNAFGNISKVDPELAKNLQSTLSNKIDTFNLARQASNPELNLIKPIQSLKSSSAWIGAKAGQGANAVLNASKRLYDASPEQLQAFSQKLISSGNGTGKNAAIALDKAVKNNDTMAKNAVLFSIMQNPALRSLVNGDEE